MTDIMPLSAAEEEAWRNRHRGTDTPFPEELIDRLFATIDVARDEAQFPRLVCALCLFVGESDDPEPITIMNGQLTCEPHNGYFQGGDQTQAIIAWRHQHPGE